MKRWLAVLCALALLTGCAGGTELRQQKVSYTLGVVLKAMGSQHWMDMRAGMTDAAADFNVDLILLYPEDERAAREQARMFRDLVAMEPDLILLAPCDSDACAPLAAAAAAADIPLLTVDTAANDTALPYVGADNERIGRMAATRLAGLMERRGEVAVISGVENQASHTGRVEGFRDALSGYPEIQIAEVYHGDSEFELGMQCMERILREHPVVRGVFCTNAVMGLGAVEQLRGREDAPYVVAVDTQDDALAALQNGTLQGLVTQDGYEVGYRAVACAVDRLEGRPAEERVYIGADLLTPDSVGEYIRERRNAA